MSQRYEEAPAGAEIRHGVPIYLAPGGVLFEQPDVSKMNGVAMRPRGAGMQRSYAIGDQVRYLVEGSVKVALLRNCTFERDRIQTVYLMSEPHYFPIQNGKIDLGSFVK